MNIPSFGIPYQPDAAVVGASRLMGLTQQQMVHAIGITVGGNTAINQGRVGTLSNWKDFASAEASRKAIFSAQLAQAGMTGPSQVFEGRDGVLQRDQPQAVRSCRSSAGGAVRHHAAPSPSASRSDSIRRPSRRPQRKCGRSLPDTGRDPGGQHPRLAQCDQGHGRQPRQMAAAEPRDRRSQHAVCGGGGVDVRHDRRHYYEDPYLHDPRLLDLVSRVRCIPSEEADRHEKDYNLCDLEIVLKSGERRSRCASSTIAGTGKIR